MGGKVEAVTDFIFLGSKITVDGDFSHEIKRCLLFGRKGMTKLDNILKSRDIPLPTKVCGAKAMVFPVVIYRCDSWTPREAEHERADAFTLRCWRRLLRVPWTAWRSNQSILKEISPEYSLEGPMLKPKLQYFGHLMWRADIWKDPDAAKDWVQEEKGWQRIRLLDSITDSVDMSVSKFQDIVEDREAWWLQSMGLQGVGHKWASEQQEFLQQLPWGMKWGGHGKEEWSGKQVEMVYIFALFH